MPRMKVNPTQTTARVGKSQLIEKKNSQKTWVQIDACFDS